MRITSFFKFAPLLAAFGLLSATLYAQPSPIFDDKFIDPSGHAVSVAGPSGSMFVALTEPAPNSSSQTKLIKLDAHGQIVWQSLSAAVALPNPNDVREIVLCPDSGILVLSCYSSEPDNGGLPVIHKFSAGGTNLWNAPLLGTDLFEAHITVDSNNSVFASDNVYSHDGGVSSSVDAFDSAGIHLWHQTLGAGDNLVTQIGGIMPDGTGGAYCTAGYQGDAASDQDIAPRLNGIVLVDFKGDAPFLVPQPDSAYGTLHESLGMVRDASGNFYTTAAGNLMKLDPSGVMVWEKNFGTLLIVKKLGIDPFGNPIVAYNTQNSSGFKVANLAKITSAGDIAWTNTFLPSGAQLSRMEDFTVDSSGRVTILTTVGYVTFARATMVNYLADGSLGWPSQDGAIQILDGDSGLGVSLSADLAGNLYVSGNYSSSVDSGFFADKYGLAAGNNSAFVSQNVPTTIIAGQSYAESLTFTNTGGTAWTSAGGYYLRSANPTNNLTWGRNQVMLSASDNILPGQSKKFSFFAIAPMVAGTYNFQWGMAQNNHGFGANSVNRAIVVVVRQNAARYISQAVPTTSVKAGSAFLVRVTMENVGTTTWTQATGFGIAPAPSYENWGVGKVSLTPAQSIGHGASVSFFITCTAPSSPGNYTMRWQMRRDSASFTGFFGDLSTSKTVVVVP